MEPTPAIASVDNVEPTKTDPTLENSEINSSSRNLYSESTMEWISEKWYRNFFLLPKSDSNSQKNPFVEDLQEVLARREGQYTYVFALILILILIIHLPATWLSNDSIPLFYGLAFMFQAALAVASLAIDATIQSVATPLITIGAFLLVGWFAFFKTREHTAVLCFLCMHVINFMILVLSEFPLGQRLLVAGSLLLTGQGDLHRLSQIPRVTCAIIQSCLLVFIF